MATQQIKDILSSDRPQPTFSIRPTVAAPIPNEVEFLRSGSALTLDPERGEYRKRDTDIPRVYGSGQAIRLENGGAENLLTYGSDLRQWGSAGIQNVGSRNSILETAGAWFLDPSTSDGRVYRNPSAILSGKETVSWMVEDVENAAPSITVSDVDNGYSRVAKLKYDIGSGTFSALGAGVLEYGAYEITPNGPQGGPVVRLWVTYDPSLNGSTNNTGQVVLRADEGGGLSGIISHNAQVSPVGLSTPIAAPNNQTESTNGDSFTIFSGGEPSWWNGQEGTIFMEMEPVNQIGGQKYWLFGEDFDHLFLFHNKRSGDDTLTSAGPNGGTSVSAMIPRKRNKVALSMTGSEIRLARDGEVSVGSSGRGLLNTDILEIGKQGRAQIDLYSFRYLPKALPAKEADRSAGDPVSLETLTS